VDHVPEVDADPELHSALWVSSSVALGHGLLDGDGALHGVHDARELRENAVAGRVYDATGMLAYQGHDHGLVRFEIADSRFVVGAHEGAIAGDIGSKDRCQFAGNLWICRNIGHPRASGLNVRGRLAQPPSARVPPCAIYRQGWGSLVATQQTPRPPVQEVGQVMGYCGPNVLALGVGKV
jgi:hypothetical protein